MAVKQQACLCTWPSSRTRIDRSIVDMLLRLENARINSPGRLHSGTFVNVFTTARLHEHRLQLFLFVTCRTTRFFSCWNARILNAASSAAISKQINYVNMWTFLNGPGVCMGGVCNENNNNAQWSSVKVLTRHVPKHKEKPSRVSLRSCTMVVWPKH